MPGPVSTSHAVPARRRKRRPGAGAPPNAGTRRNPVLPTLKPLPGSPTIAGGTWPVDVKKAEEYARRTLAQIDWSKKDIILFVSGTADPGVVPKIDPAFTAAAYTAWREGGMSLNLLRYESSWDMQASVATGIHALRLVLAGLAAHKGDHRILVAGLSQGSWVVSEALRDPTVRRVADRTVMLGHPNLAANHYDDGRDPGVLEINDEWDRIASPLKRGTESNALAAFLALRSPKLEDVPLIARALVANPKPGLLSILAAVREKLPTPLFHLVPEPHEYQRYMLRAAHFLKTGVDVAPGANATESLRLAEEALKVKV